MSDNLPWGLKSDGLTPGSMKNISSLKLKAFNIGNMNVRKGMSKKEQEELKKRQEEEDAAKVYQEFVESFEDTGKSLNRSWVKGGLARQEKEAAAPQTGRLYKPSSKLLDQAVSKQPGRETPPKPPMTDKQAKLKKANEKKKSNLELFKEELQRIQEERQERRRSKVVGGPSSAPIDISRKTRFDPIPEPPAAGTSLGLEESYSASKSGYMYSDDMQTTNLYLGNICPKMSESSLCELFGKFGPLASVKIMWPRSEEERSRGRNCGFVAFMNRKDGERALANLQGKEIDGFEMKLGWGKAVPIPPHPVYVPPALAELTLPPPPSGLPFNCQPNKHSRYYMTVPPQSDRQQTDEEQRHFEKTLANAVVKVVIPTERALLQLIHRVIEFVVREGPMFEAMIMNREMNNPQYRFLFENLSPAHVYYRWKLFSILQGDTPYNWRSEPFYMFKGGSLWLPPPLNPYTQGMPAELINQQSDSVLEEDERKGQLSETQRDRLEDMLRDLTPEKFRVGEGMVWCLEHAESAEEVVECIAESLSLLETPLPKKIARIYLVSDILHNSCAKVPHASFYRKYFECKLPEVFKDVHEYYEKISGRLKAEQFKNRVMACFRAWEEWAIYPNDFLIKLQNVFLGLVSAEAVTAEIDNAVDGMALDVDGMPLDVDGEPIGIAAISDHSIIDEQMESMLDEMVDGLPLKDDVDGAPLEDDETAPKFVQSKWETVDESELEAQAVTTSKWELLEQEEKVEESPQREEEQEDVDGAPMDLDGEVMDSPEQPVSDDDDGFTKGRMTEERRAKLREIELKVMKYQDELEMGKRTRKSDMTFVQQVQYYRKKLLNKEEEKEREKQRDRERERRRKEEEVKIKEWERARDKERERELREREKQERERDRLVKQIRELSRAEKERNSERRSRKDRSRDQSRDQSESPDSPSTMRSSLGMLMRYGRGSASRSPSPIPVPSRSHRSSRGVSPPSAYLESDRSNRPSFSPKVRPGKRSSHSQSRSPSSNRRSKRQSRSPPPQRHKHKKHKSRH